MLYILFDKQQLNHFHLTGWHQAPQGATQEVQGSFQTILTEREGKQEGEAYIP